MENIKEKSVQEGVRPCPFCGSTEILIDKCSKRVRCKKCYATSGLITRFADKGEGAALAAWNERYEDAKNDGE